MSKRILITGKDSYIGDSFAQYAKGYSYTVDIVDMLTDEWEAVDFSSYDAVVHVAAIVHKKNREVTEQDYLRVNSDLAFEVAKKAKDSGVGQFVFLSSMGVYGMSTGVISKDTPINPQNAYARSKAQAEKRIGELCDDSFTVTILRAPIVYGENCKGNYTRLSAFAKKTPILADYSSQRSMIYIDNLSSFIKKAIDEKLCGVFCPQDENYVDTSYMMKCVAQLHGRKIKPVRFLNPFITLALRLKINVFLKVFGSLIYDDSLKLEFDRVPFEKAIRKTENIN